MVERYKRFDIIKDYINSKLSEIEGHNISKSVTHEALVNGRSLTNIGTFRAYILAYLKNHPKIHSEMTFLIRQLEPAGDGVPIEIYVFVNDTNWVSYESIQSDIFDHFLAVASEFDLRVFQNPTGNDFKRLS